MPIAFRAHPVASISLPVPGAYNQIILPDVTPGGGDKHTGYNLGARYNTTNGAWTPVQGEEPDALLSFAGQVWITGSTGVASGVNFVARIVKNGLGPGVTCGAAIASKGPFTGDWVIPISMQDLATAGDEYRLYVFTRTTGPVIDGHPLHTWWSGAVT
jgi:hypothetical protein